MTSGRIIRPAFLVCAASILTACAARTTAPVGQPVAEPTATAAELVQSSTPTDPRQITFTWTLDESGSRVRGRGVVRLEPPDRLRLDLFGPRNETVLAAAMIGDDVRLPPGARTDVAIPSPALLWGGLGAIRPPAGASLQSATTAADETILRYTAANGETYEYSVANAPEARLRRVQRIGSEGPLETVRLEWSETGDVTRATYRDWGAYRDLTLEIQENVVAEDFSEDIWTP